MLRVERAAADLRCREIVVDAQIDALPFYDRLGYVAEGPTFVEAGLVHRRMTKSIR
jgi:predicted GNAT family N-acyltransferase